MLFKESNVPFASDWMLLSYSDLQQMHTLVVTTGRSPMQRHIALYEKEKARNKHGW
jgi:hypothetical protein